MITKGAVEFFRASLLGWYDRHARILPWRAPPGVAANPYHVWLSEIMLQQTTVAAVISYFHRFIERWPKIQDIAAAPAPDVMAAWAGLGYYARARNLHRCAQIVANEFGGRFPETEDALRQLPGIGAYTAAAISAIAFDQPATVIDGNVDRVVARWFGIEKPLPAAKADIRQYADHLMAHQHDRPGDFAQALMDLGATLCTPRDPKCGICPVAAECRARKLNLQGELPRRAPKTTKPEKTGDVFWVTNNENAVLLEKRPDRGLLGGMYGLPTSMWLIKDEVVEDESLPSWLTGGTARPSPSGTVRHVFTHFVLNLRIKCFHHPGAGTYGSYIWHPVNALDTVGLPTLFRKCVLHTLT